MFGLKKRRAGQALVAGLHGRIVDASRDPALYGAGGFPDTVEGRFEALSLWTLIVLRRLRRLPPPADDVGQELVDSVFAHLEIALRASGIGDFGVPKRMKKLGRAFYDRASTYDPLLDGGDPDAVAAEAARRIGDGTDAPRGAVRAILMAADRLRGADLDALLRDEPRVALFQAGDGI